MKRKLLHPLPSTFFALSILFAVLSFFFVPGPVASRRASAIISRMVASQTSKLDRFAQSALEVEPGQWWRSDDLPEGFVLYKYNSDTIQFWAGRFPVMPDVKLTEEYSCHNLGGSPYLVKIQRAPGRNLVLAGLDLRHLTGPYIITPLSTGSGEIVSLAGIPVFRIALSDDLSSTPLEIFFIILFLVCFIAACIMLLASTRKIGHALLMTLAELTVILIISLNIPTETFQHSIWLIFLYSAGTFVSVLSIFMARRNLREHLSSRKTLRAAVAVMSVVLSAVILGAIFIMVYHIEIRFGISMELYKVDTITWQTALSYISVLLMILCIPMLLHIGVHLNIAHIRTRIIYAVIGAAFIVGVTTNFGLLSEKQKIMVLAEKLSVRRDVRLERLLRNQEIRIASDPVIAMAVDMVDASYVVESRIRGFLQPLIGNDYKLTVSVGENVPSASGDQVSPGSRFKFTPYGGGRCRYSADFIYYGDLAGVSRVLVELEPRARLDLREPQVRPNNVFVPARYSFAKYEKTALQFYRGAYPFPGKLPSRFIPHIKQGSIYKVEHGGYAHFFIQTSEDTTVVLSRPSIGEYLLVVDLIFFILILLGLVTLLIVKSIEREDRTSRYYKRRISAVLMGSLVITLAALAAVSILYVYKRNEENTSRVLSDRIGTIRVMMDAAMEEERSLDGMNRRDVFLTMRKVGDAVNSDLALFRPDGSLYLSLLPQIYDGMTTGSIIDPKAFDQIVNHYRSVYTGKATYPLGNYSTLYAPVINRSGTTVGIVACPFSSGGYDFESEAITHSATIIIVFIALLLIAAFLTSFLVDKMLEPLYAMSRKMKQAGIDSLEYIDYDRKDEVSSIVDSYNRMVERLSDSLVQLAQAERDKAWSEMARQVAHEIKNPLTPMKLQIQRLIRLRSAGDNSWQEKFEDVSKLLLEHIDILSDTANEFSTFAKLYTEQPTQIDLTQMLQQEISMFSANGSVNIEYSGLDNIMIQGPKPQLTRVVVNLLSNAIQACAQTPQAQVIVSTRKSSSEGFVEISFEDNGPGVSEDNLDKLFTPNFTTKSSGSGLGLAICRSVLERCGATISYSRSVLLGGACFTICYPEFLLSLRVDENK